MNRIESAKVAEDLSQTLREATGKKVSGIKLGDVYDLEGGGLGRSGTANLDGKQSAFVAVEINGQLGIYDSRLSPYEKAVHEILGRSETQAQKNLNGAAQATKAAQSQAATGAKPAGAGWPERPGSKEKISASARVRRR